MSSGRIVSSTVRARYSEVDQMGFVYHPHYLSWCEIARTDFIRGLGMSYAELERSGLLLAVIDVQLRYEKAARYDDVVRVECVLDRVQSRSVTFTYQIFRTEPAPEQRLATAMTRLVALAADGTPRTLPPELLENFRNALDTPRNAP